MDEVKRIIMTEDDRAALAFARRVLTSSEHADETPTLQAILCLDSLASQYDQNGG